MRLFFSAILWLSFMAFFGCRPNLRQAPVEQDLLGIGAKPADRKGIHNLMRLTGRIYSGGEVLVQRECEFWAARYDYIVDQRPRFWNAFDALSQKQEPGHASYRRRSGS